MANERTCCLNLLSAQHKVSLEPPTTTTINIIPPTPSLSASVDPSNPPNTAATAASRPTADDDDAGDDGVLLPVAEDRIDPTSEWLRRHVDIFTHLTSGL